MNNKNLENLINKPIENDLSNWNICDLQMAKSLLLDMATKIETFKFYLMNKFNVTQNTEWLDILMEYGKIFEGKGGNENGENKE